MSEAATTLLNGGLTARRKVAEACFTLAARHGAADMVSGGEKVDDACFLAAVEAKIGVTLLVQCTVNLNAPYSSEFDYFRRFTLKAASPRVASMTTRGASRVAEGELSATRG